jgi:CheY-like chemotaxis protein
MRILIVDDNANARETLKMILELEGYDVADAESAGRALEIIDFQPPDVALVDIELPGADGYQLARTIRRNPRWRPLRLVAVTGHDEPEDRRRGREAGFDVHLAKPIDLDWLLGFLARPAAAMTGDGLRIVTRRPRGTAGA